MQPRALIFIALAIAASFLGGRMSAPEKVKIETKVETKIVEVEKKSEEKSGDTIQVVTNIVKPDGTKLTRTRTEHKVEEHSETESVHQSDVSKTVSKEITNRRSVVVSALAGIGLTSLSSGIVYGVSVQKEVLGPINLGGFAFNDGRVGLSIGLEF